MSPEHRKGEARCHNHGHAPDDYGSHSAVGHVPAAEPRQHERREQPTGDSAEVPPDRDARDHEGEREVEQQEDPETRPQQRDALLPLQHQEGGHKTVDPAGCPHGQGHWVEQ